MGKHSTPLAHNVQKHYNDEVKVCSSLLARFEGVKIMFFMLTDNDIFLLESSLDTICKYLVENGHSLVRMSLSAFFTSFLQLYFHTEIFRLLSHFFSFFSYW